ncbi:hypothetical protein Dimus_007457 [Dionaea muscipula]
MAAVSSLSFRPTFSSSSPLHLHNRSYTLSSTHFPATSLTLKPKTPKPFNPAFSSNLSLSPLSLLFPLYTCRFSSAIDDVLGQPAELGADPEEQRGSGVAVDEDEGEGSIGSEDSLDARRLFVGNLSYSMTSNQLTEVFSEAGQVQSVEIIYDRVTGRSRGFAFITMRRVEDVEAAIQMFDGSQIGGRTVKVNLPEVPRGGERKVMVSKMRSSAQNFVDTPHRLYAGNLDWRLTSQGLREAFAEQPGVVSAKVIYEWETGKSWGYGFVSFASAEEAEAALTALNGVEVEGRPLRLAMASEKARSRRSPPPALDFNSPNTATTDQREFLSSIVS